MGAGGGANVRYGGGVVMSYNPQYIHLCDWKLSIKNLVS